MTSTLLILVVSVSVLYCAPLPLLVWALYLYSAASRRGNLFRRLGHAFLPIALTHLVAALTAGALLVKTSALRTRLADTIVFYGLPGLFLLVPAVALATVVRPLDPTADPVPGLDSFYAVSIVALAFFFAPGFFMAYFVAST